MKFKSFNTLIPALIWIFIILGCKRDTDSKTLMPEERVLIQEFIGEMNQALQNEDLTFFRENWNADVFKRSIGNLDYVQKGVLDEYYRTGLSSVFRVLMDNLILDVRDSICQRLYLGNNFKDNYAEVTFMMKTKDNYSFRRFKISMVNEEPQLTDVYQLKEEEWMSSITGRFVKLSTRHTAGSPERTETNQNILYYQQALMKGDTLSALAHLQNIPKSHQLTNSLRIAKITLAEHVNDSIFVQVLEEEQQGEENLYIDYLTAFYTQDSIAFMDILPKMANNTGIEHSLLKKIHKEGLVWY